ncbi:uncharacterized protein LOC112503733 [Cynara cardunculus var. scolymus]|uniref:uncharacterized protein LOC112503733 n=1 Tax=Cynara cardunculus var. scolymus TaxID=59895 RepID=UPI000D62C999|nr:uncharacterized protein LOC112503733 [Cynara cardunculus var. scolymus]
MFRGFSSQCQLLISQQTSLNTDLSGRLDCFVSSLTSEMRQHNATLQDHGIDFTTIRDTVASLDVRMTALSDSQSSISKAVADLSARSESQVATNQAILQSLADLHSKKTVDPTISENGDDDSASTSSSSSESDCDAPSERELFDHDDRAAVPIEGEQPCSMPSLSVDVGTIPSQDDIPTASGDLVSTHRKGKAPMTSDEEAAAAKADKITKYQSEVSSADRLVLKASCPQETDLHLLGISAEDAAKSIALQK